MNRTIRSVALGALVLGCATAAQAAPVTVDFSEVLSGPDPSAQPLVGNEWAAYNLGTAGAYWYHDSVNDPFDGYGVSVDFNDSGVYQATIDFLTNVDFVDFQWALAYGSTEGALMTVEAYGTSGLLGAFTSGSGDLSGTESFDFADDISYLKFFDNFNAVGGSAISTLRFERATAPVPEPASFLLLGLGGIGLAASRLRRRR